MNNVSAIVTLIASLALVGCEDADPRPRDALGDVNVTAGDTEGWAFDAICRSTLLPK